MSPTPNLCGGPHCGLPFIHCPLCEAEYCAKCGKCSACDFNSKNLSPIEHMRLRAKQDEAQYALWKQEAEALPWAIIRVSPRKYRVIRKAGWSWGADFGGPTCRWEFADDGPQNYEEAQKFIKLAREGKKS